MIILGIESSCDETAFALVEDGRYVLKSVKATSLPLHQMTGGIVPEVAARKQMESILPLLDEVMKGRRSKEIDALAVTKGPGLIGSLLVGLHTARALSFVWQKPLIPVNHVLAHLYANYLSGKTISLPALGIIVSGGHTELILMKGHGDYVLIGGTRDDAMGEAFDKVARFLGLSGYPGGPVIQETARMGSATAINFPRPMIESDDYDFSFSGLKTAVVNFVTKNPDALLKDVTASFQEAAVEVIVQKSLKAASEFGVQAILLAGGVAANLRLRELLLERAGEGLTVHVPTLDLCMDDAAYIASCAYFNNYPVPWQEVQANPNLRL